MIFGSCRIKKQIPFLFCLALISCLGLINHFITTSENVFETSYEVSQLSSADRNCSFSVAVWTENICFKTFENLKWFPKFPSFPDEQKCAKNFSLLVSKGLFNTAVIKRFLVSLANVEPGFYQFRVISSLSLKIYLNDNWKSRNLVMESHGNINVAVLSRGFFVNKDSCLEIITFCPPGDNFLALDWLVPGSVRFVPIHSHDLVPVALETPYQNSPRCVLPPERSTLVGFIPRSHVMKGFHVCNSNDIKMWRNSPTSRNISVFTESSLLDDFIHEVLKLIMASLQRVAPSKYPAYKINTIELARNLTQTQASRLLIDLNMTVDGLDYIERFSEYLYAYYHGNQLEFCRPLCYQWDRTVALSFVFLTDCSRSDTAWGFYFIQNIIELQQRSLEVNFRVLITACNESQRERYEARLRYSDIDRNEVVLVEGVAKRSRAMQAVLALVDNDNIVVVCESHVKMPPTIAEEVRKHTFKRVMGYSPRPYLLNCGCFPEAEELNRRWCSECGGVTAIYREDWKQILSLDIGNQDVMADKEILLDHIAKSGIEMTQVKLRGLFRI